VKLWAAKRSATSPAASIIRGPTPAIITFGAPKRLRGGQNSGFIRLWVKNSPRKSRGVPSFHAAQIARRASTYSRMRAAGRLHGMEKRRTMCGRTWVPSPSTNRPADSSWMSLAVYASAIGLRAKAMATLVPNSTRCVAPAARVSTTKGSWMVSGTKTPS
jgi:hypothetical protein